MNRESYNVISKEWQKIRDNAHINTPIKEFAAYLPANARVLDIGCGTGKPMGSYLATYDFEITGIDFAEKMIQIAQNQNIQNAQYFLADITNFETTERFDGIIAWDSLFHLQKMDQNKIYLKIANLLNTNGYFLFTHGRQDNEHSSSMLEQIFYYSSLDKEHVLELMMEVGLIVQKSRENYKEGKDERDWIVLAQKIE